MQSTDNMNCGWFKQHCTCGLPAWASAVSCFFHKLLSRRIEKKFSSSTLIFAKAWNTATDLKKL